jgi:hypothetical protein
MALPMENTRGDVVVSEAMKIYPTNFSIGTL